MASKNVTQVLIGGKIYTLSGYESEEYLQRVAAYLNGKIAEISTLDGYSRLTPEMKGLLLDLNTADDYFKLKKQADELGDQITQKGKELYSAQHELISVQMRLEQAEKALSALREEYTEAQKKIAVLEAQIQGGSSAKSTEESGS